MQATTPTSESADAALITCAAAGARYSSRPCGKPAVMALQKVETWSGKRNTVYEPLCKQHAGIEKRRKWGNGSLVEFTPEITGWIWGEITKRTAAENEHRALKQAQREASEASAKVHAAADAQVTFSVAYAPDQVTDWEASRGSAQPVNREIPRWVAKADNGERRFYDIEAKLDRAEGYPVKVGVRHSSSLTINEATALMQVLEAAIAAAKAGSEVARVGAHSMTIWRRQQAARALSAEPPRAPK